MKAELLLEIACELAEGPMWHPEEKVLYWLDILQKQLHVFDPKTNEHSFRQFNKMPGAVVPTNISNKLAVSFEDGVAIYDTVENSSNYIVRYHESKPDMRANDGKCDPWGNFWVGTMSKTCEENAGALYCLKPDGSFEKKIENCTISNGLAWDVEKSKMYFIDSIKDGINSYDYEPNSCTRSNETTVIYKPEYRYFDGMTIDTEGMLWVAHCMDSCIRRWNPETSEELLKIDLPCPKVTSLTFGGDNYSTLYITTAQEHMNADEILKFPLSGSIFKVETDFKGMKSNNFLMKN